MSSVMSGFGSRAGESLARSDLIMNNPALARSSRELNDAQNQLLRNAVAHLDRVLSIETRARQQDLKTAGESIESVSKYMVEHINTRTNIVDGELMGRIRAIEERIQRAGGSIMGGEGVRRRGIGEVSSSNPPLVFSGNSGFYVDGYDSINELTETMDRTIENLEKMLDEEAVSIPKRHSQIKEKIIVANEKIDLGKAGFSLDQGGVGSRVFNDSKKYEVKEVYDGRDFTEYFATATMLDNKIDEELKEIEKSEARLLDAMSSVVKSVKNFIGPSASYV